MLYLHNIKKHCNLFLPFSLQQWASLYQPLTFSCEPSPADPAADSYLNKLDPTKAFKGKAKVPAPKKKQSAQCNSGSATKSQGNTGRHSGTKRWEGSHSREQVQSCLCMTIMAQRSSRGNQWLDFLLNVWLDKVYLAQNMTEVAQPTSHVKLCFYPCLCWGGKKKKSLAWQFSFCCSPSTVSDGKLRLCEAAECISNRIIVFSLIKLTVHYWHLPVK